MWLISGRENLATTAFTNFLSLHYLQISTSAYMASAILGERHSLYFQGDSDLEGVFTHPNFTVGPTVQMLEHQSPNPKIMGKVGLYSS